MTRSTSEPATPSTPERPPAVSAVVVVYNTLEDRLDRCLTALRASVGVTVEIIVVDNGSTVPVQAPLADRVLQRAANGGFAAGVNDGIRTAAAANWIAIVNDDAVVGPDLLARCVAAIGAAGERCVAAAPKVLFDGTGAPHLDSCGLVVRPSGEAFSAGAGQPDIGQFDDDRTVLGPCMSAAVFRRDAFTTVGMLDERYFMYYEDVDWAVRAHLSGHVTAFVPEAVAAHEHAASTRSFGERRRYRLVQRNLLLCATANLSWRSVLSIWMGRFVAHGKALIKGPDHWSGVVSLLTAAAHTPSALCARRARRAAAILPDTDVFAFADGLTPFVDATAYRPDGSDAARRAAEARQAQARGRR